jgi:hypothetical protein
LKDVWIWEASELPWQLRPELVKKKTFSFVQDVYYSDEEDLVANKFKKKNTEDEEEDGLDLEDDEVEESVEDIIRFVTWGKMWIFSRGFRQVFK